MIKEPLAIYIMLMFRKREESLKIGIQTGMEPLQGGAIPQIKTHLILIQMSMSADTHVETYTS